jgi:hypothetical protein
VYRYGTETKLHLDGRSAEARIPPTWSMRIHVPDHAVPEVVVTRATTLKEVREALYAWGRDHPKDYVSRDLYAGKVLIAADDDAATVGRCTLTCVPDLAGLYLG